MRIRTRMFFLCLILFQLVAVLLPIKAHAQVSLGSAPALVTSIDEDGAVVQFTRDSGKQVTFDRTSSVSYSWTGLIEPGEFGNEGQACGANLYLTIPNAGNDSNATILATGDDSEYVSASERGGRGASNYGAPCEDSVLQSIPKSASVQYNATPNAQKNQVDFEFIEVDAGQAYRGNDRQAARHSKDHIDSAPQDTITIKGGDIDKSKQVSAVFANSNNDLKYAGTFYDIPPGEYEVCSEITGLCETVTKVDGQKAVVSASTSTEEASTATDNNPSCETTGNPLSWILCPLINGIAEVADFMFENIIQPLLVARNLDYIQPGSGMYQVWSSFRVIANILLIVVLLVIVFGQAIGGGLIDAYTAKKALPRVFAAAILINLSIYLVAFALDVTNIIGAGLSNIIYAPFQGAGEFKIQLGNTSSILAYIGIGGGIWAAVSAGGALLQVIPVILLFVVVPAVLAFLAVVVTLVLRQGIIILLILISPVAFLAFVLPNTEQYFKKWWDLLLKTLLVYPIVMVIFAISDVLAAVLSGSFPFAVQWVADLVSILLLVLPLFLIPFSFKLAGGAIGQIFGALDGFGKKGGELLKGSERDPASMRNRYRYKARSALNDKDMTGAALGTRVNPFIGLGKGGLKGYRERRGARLTAQRSNMQAILGEDAAGGAFFKQESMDDKPMKDLALYGTREESLAAIEERAQKETGKIQAAFNSGQINKETYESKLQGVESTRQQELVASAAADRIGRTTANRRNALMQSATIAYGLGSGEEGWSTATKAMEDIAGGDDAQIKQMVNAFQYHAKAAGRSDLSANTDSTDYNGYRADQSVGLYQKGNGKPAAIKGDATYYKDLWRRTKTGDLKQHEIESFTKHLTDTQKAGMGVDDLKAVAVQRAKEQVAIQRRELTKLGQSGTGAAHTEALNQKTIMEEELGPADVQQLDLLISDPAVSGRARGYDPTDRGGGPGAPDPNST